MIYEYERVKPSPTTSLAITLIIIAAFAVVGLSFVYWFGWYSFPVVLIAGYLIYSRILVYRKEIDPSAKTGIIITHSDIVVSFLGSERRIKTNSIIGVEAIETLDTESVVISLTKGKEYHVSRSCYGSFEDLISALESLSEKANFKTKVFWKNSRREQAGSLNSEKPEASLH